jgi:hypothetical protein
MSDQAKEASVGMTNEEAQLVVQLSRWGTEMGLEEALAEIFSETFTEDQAAGDDPSVRKALSYFETVATLSTRGAISRDLVHDLWWVSGIWERVQPHVEAARKGSGESRLYENFELLVNGEGG